MYQRPQRARIVFVVLMLAAVTVLTLDFREREGGPVERLQQTAISLFGPLQRGVSAVLQPIGSAFNAVTGVFSLASENQRLTEEVKRLRALERTYQDVLSENQELRNLLGMAQRCGCETVGAQVVARSGSNFQWSVSVNAGSNQGVAKGMAVINAEGLVGRVVEVSPNYSTVMLITDPSSGVAARLAGSKTPGLLRGGGSEELKLELLKTDAKAKVGEPVVTQGYREAIFPPGLPIGVVSKVPKDTDLVRRITVTPFISTSALDAVAIVVSEPRPPAKPKGQQQQRTASPPRRGGGG